MTEQEWLSENDPQRLLKFLKENAGQRKLRLFAVACSRRVFHFLYEVDMKRVEVAERFADGLCSEADLSIAWDVEEKFTGYNIRNIPIAWINKDYAEAAAGDTADPNAYEAAWSTSTMARRAVNPAEDNHRNPIVGPEHHAQAELLRDIFGNPFRPIDAERVWQTRTIKAIAQTIYSERQFEDMPILADALEEAGCNNEVILDHCRKKQEHSRGCWLLDLLLGKK